MTSRLITYPVKPEAIEENQKLVEAVFAELHAKSPPRVRYLVLKLEDGSFCHLVEDEAKVIVGLDAFKAFQNGGAERRLEAPRLREATIIGDYGVIADGDEPKP